MSESLRGQLLIASPALIDPNFRRTVVLIVAHDEDGAVGLVLNRRTETEVAEAVPELADLVDPGELVSIGGPVQTEAVVVLAEWDDLDEAGAIVFDDIGLMGAALEKLGIEYSYTGSASHAWMTVLLMDVWHWTPLVALLCYAGLRSIPEYIYEAAEVDCASNWRQFWSITLPMALPFIMLAVLFRGIENFKMFDMVNLLTGGGPGSTTEVASITLKRQAFESWRTGYSSAFAIILFVAVFGLANIYVKALNKVKQR